MILQTVLGRIAASDFGFALPHEHVMCDFVGADATHAGRWDMDAVVAAILPRLLAIRDRGVSGFVDCTPAYIGRDPLVLRRLAEETGLHILTNTGYYGGANDRFVPAHAYAETAEQLARRWALECEQGIAETGVLPGFIKIGVDEIAADGGQLSAIDAKLVHAAALASQATGLSVTCHTGGGPAGYAALLLFMAEGGAPARFIVAHSDGHGHAINAQIAEAGAWVSYDSIGWRPTKEHLPIILPMLDQIDRLLLSQDSGWYWVGESGGGTIRGYSYLTDDLLPALRTAGVSAAQIETLTVANPARAFGR